MLAILPRLMHGFDANAGCSPSPPSSFPLRALLLLQGCSAGAEFGGHLLQLCAESGLHFISGSRLVQHPDTCCQRLLLSHHPTPEAIRPSDKPRDTPWHQPSADPTGATAIDHILCSCLLHEATWPTDTLPFSDATLPRPGCPPYHAGAECGNSCRPTVSGCRFDGILKILLKSCWLRGSTH